MRVIYFIDDKMGGVSSLCYNLVTHSPDLPYEQWVIHIDFLESSKARANLKYPNAESIHFKYSGLENTYSTIKRLYKSLPTEPGALVVNYELEMEMLDHYPVRQTIYQLVHDNYNLALAIKFEHLVDVFIAHNKYIYDQLIKSLKTKKFAVFYLPHGVAVPPFYRKRNEILNNEKLKLLFLGRLDEKKGIFDLPAIGRLLRENNISVEWTCIGNGPEKQKLINQWKDEPNLVFLNPTSNIEVLEIASQHDVFVLPTKFEGSPVSLIETMSVGLVPIITDLEGSIREIVDADIGFRIPMDDNLGFAVAITKLNEDRKLLSLMGDNCRKKIISDFNILCTAPQYHNLFKEYSLFYCPKKLQKNKIGARLDQPWLPSFITRTIRQWRRG
ncbi:MAG: glycosyltransferase, partial [Saprospiraceae bacterium]|nr:glycosyltransferase [Saprospiraceae bacterium]